MSNLFSLTLALTLRTAFLARRQLCRDQSTTVLKKTEEVLKETEKENRKEQATVSFSKSNFWLLKRFRNMLRIEGCSGLSTFRIRQELQEQHGKKDSRYSDRACKCFIVYDRRNLANRVRKN